MRKQTQYVVAAFLKRELARGDNTKTDGETLLLFENKIAWFDAQDHVWVQTCGFGTNTTLDRLNAIVEVVHGRPHHFSREAGQLKEGGATWDGSPLDLGTYRAKP